MLPRRALGCVAGCLSTLSLDLQSFGMAHDHRSPLLARHTGPMRQRRGGGQRAGMRATMHLWRPRAGCSIRRGGGVPYLPLIRYSHSVLNFSFLLLTGFSTLHCSLSTTTGSSVIVVSFLPPYPMHTMLAIPLIDRELYRRGLLPTAVPNALLC